MPRNIKKRKRYKVIEFQKVGSPLVSEYYSVQSIIDEYNVKCDDGVKKMYKELVYYHLNRHGVFEFGENYSVIKTFK